MHSHQSTHWLPTCPPHNDLYCSTYWDYPLGQPYCPWAWRVVVGVAWVAERHELVGREGLAIEGHRCCCPRRASGLEMVGWRVLDEGFELLHCLNDSRLEWAGGGVELAKTSLSVCWCCRLAGLEGSLPDHDGRTNWGPFRPLRPRKHHGFWGPEIVV